MKRETLEINEKNKKYKTSWVKTLDKGLVEVCIEPELEDSTKTCFISSAINCLLSKNRKKRKRCKTQRDDSSFLCPDVVADKKRSISLCCDSNDFCDSLSGKPSSKAIQVVPYSSCDSKSNWLVNAVDLNTGERISYSCKYLVLANGSSDQPNRLECSKGRKDPPWLFYDLRNLEQNLDNYVKERQINEDVDPVLVIGAGLSAADAVIAVRGRNVPVVHVFRSRSPDFSKQLPENLYPEYHKVSFKVLKNI